MKFTNEVEISLPADDVFATLTDVERVAGCLPGARVEGKDGDVHRGAMRIKVGPITADYAGTLSFEELEPRERRAVLLARGEEKAGQGSAEARIVSSVLEDGDGARIVVETDLQVRGRVAQFGSGAMEKIAKRLFDQFAGNLEKMMQAEPEQPGTDGQGSAETASSNHSAPATSGGPEPPGDDAAESSLDVVGLLARPVGRAALPVVIAFAVGYLLGRRAAS
jgi:hypothetical protein